MTSRVEICLPWLLEMRCGFDPTKTENGVRQKYCQGPTFCRISEDISTEGIDARSSQFLMTNR